MFFFFILALSLGFSADAVLAFFRSSGGLKKFQNLLAAAVFGYASWVIYTHRVSKTLNSYNPEIYAIATGIFVLVAIPKPSLLTANPFAKVIKWALYTIVGATVAVSLGLASYKNFAVGKPFLLVTMTGSTRQESIEKLQTLAVQKEILLEYQVILEDVNGEKISEHYFYGDLIGIRVKTLQFSPLYTFFGLEPCYRLDMVYNGFMQSSSYASFPIQAISLYTESSFLQFFEQMFHKFWGKTFYGEKKFSWIKAAALQSQYFPLAHQDKPFVGKFELSLYSSGISGKQL